MRNSTEEAAAEVWREQIRAVLTAASGCSVLLTGGEKEALREKAAQAAGFRQCALRAGRQNELSGCGQCASCRLMAGRQHPDVHWLEPQGASASIKIGDIRRLREELALKPYYGAGKIAVIEDAQRLTAESANALLKILEEPPAAALIILTAPHAAQLLPTVVSRCRMIRFSGAGPGAAVQEEHARFLADILERAGPPQEYKLVEAAAGLERRELEQLLQELAFVFRDLVMLALPVSGSAVLSGFPPQKLSAWAELFAAPQAAFLCGETLRIRQYIRNNANVKLSLDVLCKTIQARRGITNDFNRG